MAKGRQLEKSIRQWHGFAHFVKGLGMADLTLVIGTKNYSSWSLRPWIALKVAGIPFKEVVIRLRQPDTQAQILNHSPAGKVPILKEGDLTIWDSLAILEYLSDRFPGANLWPTDLRARGVARAVSAEMHSGFGPLRQQLPMDIRSRFPLRADEAAQVDIDRIQRIWKDCRGRFGAGGKFLFGPFTAADAMFAPVVTRMRTYGVSLEPVSETYCKAVFGLPAMREWEAAAEAENDVIVP